LVLAATLTIGPTGSAQATRLGPRIYLGAWLDGHQYGFENPPWDMRALARFEAHAGRTLAILHFGQPWAWRGALQPFYPETMDAVRRHGSIPMVDWSSWDPAAGSGARQPDFALSRILAGSYDDYIRGWAIAARRWGAPFFLRFDHEMNLAWTPWSTGVNGNTATEYVQVWRHVHAIFASVGATNVTWVWAPNVIAPGDVPLASLYPGDAEVDWLAMDGYNWGSTDGHGSGWQSFAATFAPTYQALRLLAPHRPIMVAEVASTEHGGDKAAWIRDALGTQVPRRFPAIRAVVWFNWNVGGNDWSIESSPGSRRGFAAAVRSPVYVGNQFGRLGGGVIGVVP
jgi:hypothetical protein